MHPNYLEPGNMIFAAKDIINDGSMPDLEENALLAKGGQRGVIINTGHLEEDPDTVLVLVRFENEQASGDLGPAVTCLPEELYLPEEYLN